MLQFFFSCLNSPRFGPGTMLSATGLEQVNDADFVLKELKVGQKETQDTQHPLCPVACWESSVKGKQVWACGMEYTLRGP